MVDFMDDKQLLGEMKRGNNAAFEFLFKSYYPRLRGYAIRFIEDEETVRDIIQECFLRFWERREMLSAFSLTSLLFSMVRNGCHMYIAFAVLFRNLCHGLNIFCSQITSDHLDSE